MLRQITRVFPFTATRLTSVKPISATIISRCASGLTEEEAKASVTVGVDTEGVATVTLNRPHLFNAFSDLVCYA
jgi:hypothetical protein